MRVSDNSGDLAEQSELTTEDMSIAVPNPDDSDSIQKPNTPKRTHKVVKIDDEELYTPVKTKISKDNELRNFLSQKKVHKIMLQFIFVHS